MTASIETETSAAPAARTSPISEYLEQLLDECRALKHGDVATYFPELGRADPDWFGISVVTAEGHVYAVGDSDLLVVHELQGELHFASTEIAFQSIVGNLHDVRYVVLDLRRVGDVDSAAAGLLTALDATVGDDVSLVLAHVRSAARRLFPSVATATPLFANADAALEWCEDQLLASTVVTPVMVSKAVDLGANDLLRGLSDEQLAEVAHLAQLSEHATGETILREGDGSDAVYLLLSGTVTVWLDVGDDGRRHRLATFGPGMAFGEMALLVEGPRSADVAADEPVVAARLAVADLRSLELHRPELISIVYRNLARTLGGRLRRANAQVRALEG